MPKSVKPKIITPDQIEIKKINDLPVLKKAIGQILTITDNLNLDETRINAAMAKGFLVSNYKEDDYLKFAKHAKESEDLALERRTLFYAAIEKKTGFLAGFLVAYGSHAPTLNIGNGTTVDAVMARRVAEPFILIKQVGVFKEKANGSEEPGKPLKKYAGVGQKLYTQIFEDQKNMGPGFRKIGHIAAIVTDPRNEPSIDFHERNQFQYLCSVIPKTADNQDEMTRGVWIRFPFEANDVKGMGNKLYTKIKKRILNTFPFRWTFSAFEKIRYWMFGHYDRQVVRYPLLHPFGPDDIDQDNEKDRNQEITFLIHRAKDALSLYQHEDRLNWTKIRLLTLLMTGFLAAFSFYLKADSNFLHRWDSLAVGLVVFIFGLGINVLFMIKIKSGLAFFRSHKDSAKEYETKLYWRHPELYPLLKGRLFRRSMTAKILGRIPGISMALFLICWAILLFKL